MNFKKMREYAYDVAMDTLYIVLGHSGKAKRSPFVDLEFLRKYSPNIMDVSVAIDGIRYWVRMSYMNKACLEEVDHASIVYDRCVYGHCMTSKGLLLNVGRD